MKFGYTILYVASVEDTLAFYEKAFGLPRGMVAPGGVYGELVTGGTKLAFADNGFVKGLHGVGFAPAAIAAPAPAMEIALVADDVEAAFAKAVAAGAAAVKSPVKKPWGQLVGYVRDINGFIVELCSPMG